MKFSALLSFIVVTVAVAFATDRSASERNAIPSHPSQIVYGEFNWNVPIGSPYRETLKNGLRIYAAVDSTLPLIQITGIFRGGTLADLPGKEGACSLMGRLMRVGGTARYSADTLDDLIDRYAMEFNLSATEDGVQFSASFLSDYVDTAFDILQQILFQPRFEDKKLDQEKKIDAEDVRHRFDDPGPTLGAAYQKLLYSGSAASRMTTEQSLQRIKRSDLITLHDRLITTGNCVLAIAGKFNRPAILERLEKAFPQAVPLGDTGVPAIAIAPPERCLMVHKPITQAYVQFGWPLFKRPNPDFFPVSVANFILGGSGFTSRLGSRVRSDAGLTYSIRSAPESNYTYPGSWYVEFFTKSESFGQAMALSLAVIDEVRTKGITSDELANAKETMLASMPSMFRSPFDIVTTYAWNEFYGRSPLYYRQYPDNIKAVTTDDATKMIGKYLDPAACSYTIVGDTVALAKYGTVKGFTLNSLAPRKTILPDSLPLLP